MKNLKSILMILLLAVVAGCSSGNSDAPVLGGLNHPGNWISLHGAEANVDLRGCQGCHGFDFNGGGDAVSCFNCHSSGPPFVGAHPASWNADPLNGHQDNFSLTATPSERISWTNCAVAACHGPNLEGGTAGPTCQNASCHPTGTAGWPPAPHADYTSGAVHGPVAKGVPNADLSMGTYCLLCHGSPSNTFDGGFISAAAILNDSTGNCSAALCHPTATAHPANWTSTRAGNSVRHNDGSLDSGDKVKNGSCALCHTTTGTSPASPFPGAPTCFNANYTNNIGGANIVCHATGPGGAPHVVPYTDPALHGLAAKADPSSTTGLIYCQGCHATNGSAGTAGVAGSNPLFNVPKGSMVAGCEDCHPAGAAHPARGDRWTFDIDTNHDITNEILARRTHFATDGSVSTVCAMCHNINDADTGSGTAKACNVCHASTATFSLNCTYCHELPPITNAPDLTGGSFVDHSKLGGGDVTDILNHENCSICHGVSQNGSTGTLQAKGADYVLFSGTGQGGNHLDDCIDVNSDVGYQNAGGAVGEQFGCAAACHPNDPKHQLSGSGITTSNGRFTTGTIACNDCHGYPPDGVTAAPGATVAGHVGGAANLGADLLTFHGECQTCHGTKNNGADGHAAHANYDPAVNHYNGQINMNSATGYDAASGGCNNAVCHVNDASHQVPPTSGLTVQTGDYGAGSCTSCHDYPPKGDKIPLTAPGSLTPVDHTGSDGTGAKLLLAHGDCQVCHGTRDNGSGGHQVISPYVAGTHHQDDQIQMNTDTGYNTATFRCDSASCHVGSQSPQLSDSALPVDLLALGASAACDTCHGGLLTDTANLGPITSNAHTAHLVSTIGVSLTCDTCHGHLGVGATHNEGNGTVVAANVDVPLNNGLATGGVYSGDVAKQCSNVYCHGTSNTADWDAGTGGACGDCHGANATGRPDGVNEPSGGSHLTAAHAAEACTTCHPHAGVDTTNHVNGTVFTPANADGDAQISTSVTLTGHSYGAVIGSSPDPDGFKYSASTCTTSCHSSGTWGSAGGCDFCHGYPPDGTGGSTDHFTRTGIGSTDSDFFNAHATCATCHGVAGNAVPPASATARTGAIDLTGSGGDAYLDPAMHNDGLVQMNGYSLPPGDGTDDTNAGYNGAGGCAKACHASSYVIDNLNAGNTVELREFGSGTCTSCHNGTGTGATLVNDSSPHALAATLLTCEECHTGHGSGDIEIPNNLAVGINYSANGEAGIALGGTGTTGTTEAEICWNCHASFGQSEWGTNTQPATGNMTYNYGTLNQSNWVGATWTSGTAQFSYKTGAIQSTHSVNNSATLPGLDVVGDIRCSYCHDVHDLNTLASDSSSGKPYLRGTWMGNPYREDGAPTGAYNYYSFTEPFGAVPRGENSTNANLLGGWQIDQNNGNPTNGWTLSGSAGLCTLCHGSNVNAMNKFDVDEAGAGETPNASWVGTNGHSNAVIGGTGSNMSNIYSPTLRSEGSTYTNPKMAYQMNGSGGADGDRMYGLRNFDGNSQSTVASNMTADNNAGVYPYAHSPTNNEVRFVYSDDTTSGGTGVWGVDQDNVTAQTAYHNFSCSKCHNPHASRLPRLMITNCLDVSHNAWDDNFSADPDWTSGDANGATTNWSTAGNMAISGNKELAYAKSAQNCHRYINGVESGWNNVTPW